MSPDVRFGHRLAASGLASMAFAHSEETALRPPGCACFLRRLHDTGNPQRGEALSFTKASVSEAAATGDGIGEHVAVGLFE